MGKQIMASTMIERDMGKQIMASTMIERDKDKHNLPILTRQKTDGSQRETWTKPDMNSCIPGGGEQAILDPLVANVVLPIDKI